MTCPATPQLSNLGFPAGFTWDEFEMDECDQFLCSLFQGGEAPFNPQGEEMSWDQQFAYDLRMEREWKGDGDDCDYYDGPVDL